MNEHIYKFPSYEFGKLFFEENVFNSDADSGNREIHFINREIRFIVGDKKLSRFVFPRAPILRGHLEGVPGSGIPSPIGTLDEDGMFTFDDSPRDSFKRYHSAIRSKLERVTEDSYLVNSN